MLGHRSAYKFEKDALHLDCDGLTTGDELLIIRLLISAVIFAVAVAVKMPGWLSVCLLVLSALGAGADVIVSCVLSIMGRSFLDPCIVVAVAGAALFATGHCRDAAAVLLLFQIAELLLRMTVFWVCGSASSGSAITYPDTAKVIRRDQELVIPTRELKPGDLIIMKPGETVACDCVVASSGGAVDMSAITGNSEPVTVRENDSICAGTTVLGSDLQCYVIDSPDKSSAARVEEILSACADSIEISEKKLTMISAIFIAAVAIAAILTAVITAIVSESGVASAIHRGLSVLTLALPYSFFLAAPMAYLAAGMGEAKNGVVFRNIGIFRRLSRTKAVVFDKKGTLTARELRVTSVKSDKMDAGMMLKIAAHAEAYSSHPIAKSIIEAYSGVIYIELIQKYREFPGQGVAVMVQGVPIILGSQEFLESLGVSARTDGGVERAVFMAIGGQYAGRIIFGSAVREDAAEAIRSVSELGINRVAITTDDGEEAGKSFAEAVGAKEIHTGFSSDDTKRFIETLAAEKKPEETLVFVSADTQDTSSIKSADVGAIIGSMPECVDCNEANMLIFSGPKSLTGAIIASRRAEKVALTGLAISAGAKLVLLLLGIFGIAAPWFTLIADAAVAAATVLFSQRVVFPGKGSKNEEKLS